jgi:dCTP diphosphatase
MRKRNKLVLFKKYLIEIKNMDNTIRISELKNILQKFKEERNWGQFHDPKNLAEAISIEAGELQEKFLWRSKEEILTKMNEDSVYRKEIEEEFADVVIFCLNFANATEIDIAKAVTDKVDKNNKKYPPEKAKNTAEKYNKL